MTCGGDAPATRTGYLGNYFMIVQEFEQAKYPLTLTTALERILTVSKEFRPDIAAAKSHNGIFFSQLG
jgi:hypothetical protein